MAGGVAVCGGGAVRRRSFLLLQGPATPFFAQLAVRLRAEGHAVHRVQFCGGDVLFWRAGQARWFRGEIGGLRDWLQECYRRWGVTDQVLFGDRRPVHRAAVERGAGWGVRTHVFEEGYFRPWWVTLEREGVNGRSLLPRDPAWFWETGARLPEPPSAVPFASPFFLRAFFDVAYHVAGVANPVLFPHYRTHAGVAAPLEYAGYVCRFARLRVIRGREIRRSRELAASGRPYFLFPLQLNTDAQIRDHSRFAHMGEALVHVLASFAHHAPADVALVVKNHPLDQGLMNFARIIAQCVKRLDLEGRVHYLEDGDLGVLVRQARGVITVNSTTGIVALEQGTPTLALSDPIYNLQGLTCQLPLHAFWHAPTPPIHERFVQFRRCVMHATQINGGFYSSAGMGLAVHNAAQVLCAERSPLEVLG